MNGPDTGTAVPPVWDRVREYGLAAVLVLIGAPLAAQGLSWLLFAGHGWVLNLAAAVLASALAVAVVVHRGGDLPVRWAAAGLVAAAAALLWGAIGVADHGLAQTVTGLRLILMPIAFAVIAASLGGPAIERLLTVAAWVMTANAVAAVAEKLIGPDTLVHWGFTADHNVRYIDGVFRVPGLTQVNAELGLLAGAFALGYAVCWLSPSTRPRRGVWHIAAVAAVVCLGLSTSRSGALLVVGGLTGAVVLPRTRSRRRRIVAIVLAALLAVGLAGAFVLLGAGGSASLFQRFAVWRDLLAGVSVLGDGIGGAGGATYSRVAASPPRFVDNYFLDVGLQFGPVVMVLLVVATVATVVACVRASRRRRDLVLPIGLVCGLACASLTLDTWEFGATMLTLILFGYHGLRSAP
ncbi:hypothetical protein [Mangrovihabitans endophyticus]|uniref:O-antigen ligase n=1 Tax=Mangrovihabitans endophyticus TaxID=1751298 RepID=A0A8J3C876_9ACTN|nr:hypothetical protein [Mangrovihabitans endophyticus]GGL19532.1 hypothetical protein GCM10012284_62590 [Mangrovihabitans endophyticus]